MPQERYQPKPSELRTDQLTIATGLMPGASEEDWGDTVQVLKKYGFVPASSAVANQHKIPSTRKRGPKPESSINPTDDEINVRIKSLRLRFGREFKKLTQREFLQTTRLVISRYLHNCGAGLYLEASEIKSVRWLLSKPEDLAQDVCDCWYPVPPAYQRVGGPIVADFEKIVESLRKIYAELELDGLDIDDWETDVGRAVRVVKPRKNDPIGLEHELKYFGASIQLAVDESAEWKSLQYLLNMAWNPDWETPPTLNMDGSEEDSEFEKRMYDTPPSKNQLLRSVGGLVMQIKRNYKDCYFVNLSADIVLLHGILREIQMWCPVEKLTYPVEQLLEAFENAKRRQDRNPFPLTFFEELEIGPSSVSEDGFTMPYEMPRRPKVIKAVRSPKSVPVLLQSSPKPTRRKAKRKRRA